MLDKNHQQNCPYSSISQSFNFSVWKTLDISLCLVEHLESDISVHQIEIAIVISSFDY